MKPRVCILHTDGTHGDRETVYAFEKCGAAPELVHMNQLLTRKAGLADFQILVLPGGAAYGDGVHAGRVWALELRTRLKEELLAFVAAHKLVLGIGNGFQVLVQAGLLPDTGSDTARVALTPNDSGRFECRWVRVRVENTPCIFTAGLEGRILDYQVAHGTGRFYAPDPVLADLEQKGQVVLRYADEAGRPTAVYPHNPNGSVGAVAGLCDPSGRVFGLMPHPERYVEVTRHPQWRRRTDPPEPHGLPVFRNAVYYIQNT